MAAQTIVIGLISFATVLAFGALYLYATRADKRDEEHEAIGDASSLDHPDTPRPAKWPKRTPNEVEPRGA